MAIQAINTQSVLLDTMTQLRGDAAVAPAQRSAEQDVNFNQVMQAALNTIDAQQHHAGQLQTAVETGQSDDLVGAMVASQKAGLSFSALVQVRNRLVSGFDEIMRMPV